MAMKYLRLALTLYVCVQVPAFTLLQVWCLQVEAAYWSCFKYRGSEARATSTKVPPRFRAPHRIVCQTTITAECIKV